MSATRLFCPAVSLLKHDSPCLLTTVRHHQRRRPLRVYFWPSDWLPFEWDWPVKEMGYFKTGDPQEKMLEMEKFEEIYKPGFEFLKDRTDVPESVKRHFRLKNAHRLEQANYVRSKRNDEVKRHPFDDTSHEVMIANYTSRIRSLVEVIRAQPNHAVAKILTCNYANKREQFLYQLYRMDSKRYYALVKHLNIDTVPGIPGVPNRPKVERKASLRRLTAEYCDNIKKVKLDAYHAKLKAQQEGFMKEKEETLQWITKEMKKYDIKEEDVDGVFRLPPKFRDPTPIRPPVED